MLNSRKKNNPLFLRRRDRFRLILLGLIAGVCAGAVSILYRFALTGANLLREWLLPFCNSPGTIVLLFVTLIFFGVLTGRLMRKETLISGSGIPQVEGELMGYFSSRWARVLCLKFVGGVISMFCGLSLGREGPSVQLGAMAAKGLCDKLHRTSIERKYLISCGACAGLAAAFNAPLAGLMFGLEEIHRNFSSRALFSAMVACISAAYLSIMVFGNVSSLNMRMESIMPPRYYPILLLAGIFFGLVSCLHNKAIFWAKKLFSRWRLPLPMKMGCIFASAGVVALVLPDALGSGEGIISQLSTYGYTTLVLLSLFAVKFLFTVICASSGAPGGTLVTMLVLGALSGSIFGRFAIYGLGLPAQYAYSFILLGMAAMFSGAARAPLTGIFLVVELSGSMTHFLGLAIVSLSAVLVADLLKVKPLYEQMLEDIIPDSHGKRPTKELSTIELTVSYRSYLVGLPLSQVPLPEFSLVVTIDRQGEQVIPRGSTKIMAGDLLTIVCPAGEEGVTRKALGYNADPDEESKPG